MLRPRRLRYAPGAGRSLALGEPVVPWHIWVLLVKLSKFLQTAYRKVVIWLFRPVLPVRVVEPFNEVQDVAPLLGAPKDLVNIIFLALFDSLRWPLGGFLRCPAMFGIGWS